LDLTLASLDEREGAAEAVKPAGPRTANALIPMTSILLLLKTDIDHVPFSIQSRLLPGLDFIWSKERVGRVSTARVDSLRLVDALH